MSTATGTCESEERAPPSLSRQKGFIVENADILNAETMKAILRIVMMEVGKETVIRRDGRVVQTSPVILENSVTREVSISLDNIENPEVIRHIYNIVNNRRASLNEPV